MRIAWARGLGTEVILVPFFMRAELLSEADDERAVAAFRALCPAAAEHGVTLCFEGSLPAERIASIAARVGSDAFGLFYFDLANPLAHKGLDAPTEIRALGGLVKRVHVKDTRVRTGDCRPGTGRVDFAACALALSEIGYDGWLTLETPPAPPPLVSRDLSFTRSVFSGFDGTPRWPRLGAFSTELGEGEWETACPTSSIDWASGLCSSWGRSWTSALTTPAAPSPGASFSRSAASPSRRSADTGTSLRRIQRSDAPTSSTFADAWRSRPPSAPTSSPPKRGR